MFGKTVAFLIVGALVLAGCATSQDTAASSQSLDQMLASAGDFTPGGISQSEYTIGPLDKLAIQVFQAEELSLKEVQVDASGRIILPKVGVIRAAGLAVQDLKFVIEAALSECCLQRPQVAVLILEGQSQQVTVLGAVRESGSFPMRGRTTLLQAVAYAKGVDQTQADMGRVAVFRTTNTGREAAMFDLKDIQQAKSADPEILPGDIVVVDYSGRKGLLTQLAGLGQIFYYVFVPY